MGRSLRPPFFKASTGLGNAEFGKRFYSTRWNAYVVLGSLQLVLVLAEISIVSTHHARFSTIADAALGALFVALGFWWCAHLKKSDVAFP